MVPCCYVDSSGPSSGGYISRSDGTLWQAMSREGAAADVDQQRNGMTMGCLSHNVLEGTFLK
jgi:hypothetical protein